MTVARMSSGRGAMPWLSTIQSRISSQTRREKLELSTMASEMGNPGRNRTPAPDPHPGGRPPKILVLGHGRARCESENERRRSGAQDPVTGFLH